MHRFPTQFLPSSARCSASVKASVGGGNKNKLWRSFMFQLQKGREVRDGKLLDSKPINMQSVFTGSFSTLYTQAANASV
jgi:hypothetical protein